jgi:ribonuclease R
MLPEVISNSLASLQQRRLRYAKSAFIEFNPDGIPVHSRFANSAIKVNKRFAYEQVLPIINQPQDQTGKVPAGIRQLLCDMRELAMLLRQRRFKQGALDMAIPEIKLEFDKQGRVSGASEQAHDESHQMIEEFMLAANIAVATELSDRGIPFLRRAHGEPSPTKLKAFAEFAAVLGHRLKNPQSRRELRELLQRVKGQPEERALNYALLRSLKQAEYTPLEVGHYALAAQNYCHFTSPIRRYPDLMVHRLIDALLTGHRSKRGASGEELLRMGHHCSTTERQAQRAERELTSLKLLAHLETKIGEELDAIISGVDRFGFFAQGVELPAEGLVHISTLAENDTYDYDRAAMSLVGRRTGEQFRLGDPVRIKVVRVDVDRRQVDFRLVRGTGKTKQKKTPAGKQRTAKSPSSRKSTAKKSRRR